jgi:hypothetical protein
MRILVRRIASIALEAAASSSCLLVRLMWTGYSSLVAAVQVWVVLALAVF